MTDVFGKKIEQHHFLITLDRALKNNALHPEMIKSLHALLHQAIEDPAIRVILLQGQGQHFSAGADLKWMQQTIHYSESENIADAHILGDMLYTLYKSPKPTIALVHGAAIGGGAGLVSACDIAIATHSAQFCFSEVKLGLIPAMISPYVIQAIGPRTAKKLFLTAQRFGAEQALHMGLIHTLVTEDQLLIQGVETANQLLANAPLAMSACKKLVDDVSGIAPNPALVQNTAEWIAQKRASEEGQAGLASFLNKTERPW